jgi:hypothetical protein
MSNQNTALDAVAQARMDLKHGHAGNALEQIERAERALLDLKQIQSDPHIDDALQRLDAARAALNANYDANGQEIGPVLTFVVDPNGEVRTVIISIGGLSWHRGENCRCAEKRDHRTRQSSDLQGHQR